MTKGLIGRAGTLVFASIMSAAGCSSDGSEADAPAQMVTASGCTKASGGTAVTGLCGAAALNTLTPAETMQLCDETSAFIESAISRATSCKYVALVAAASSSSPTDAELKTACSMRENTCNQDATIAGAGAMTLCSAIPPTCTATLAQYSTCVADEAALFETQANGLTSCADLTFGNLTAIYDVPTAAAAAPSCMAIKTACPNYSLPYIN